MFDPRPLKRVRKADLPGELTKVEADEAADETEYTIQDAINEDDEQVADMNDLPDDVEVGGWSLCPAKLLAKLVKLYDIQHETLPHHGTTNTRRRASARPSRNAARLVVCVHIDETVWKAGRKLERVGIRIMNYALAGKSIYKSRMML